LDSFVQMTSVGISLFFPNSPKGKINAGSWFEPNFVQL
jgi:hypothetical protein